MKNNLLFSDNNLNETCYPMSGIEDIDSRSQLFNNLIWDIDEVSRFTKYSKGTIYNLVSCGDIPYRKRRGRLWFVPSEVLNWLKGEL